MVYKLISSDAEKAFEKFISCNEGSGNVVYESGKPRGLSVIVAIDVWEDGYIEYDYLAVLWGKELANGKVYRQKFEEQFNHLIWKYQSERLRSCRNGESGTANTIPQTQQAKECLKTSGS